MARNPPNVIVHRAVRMTYLIENDREKVKLIAIDIDANFKFAVSVRYHRVIDLPTTAKNCDQCGILETRTNGYSEFLFYTDSITEDFLATLDFIFLLVLGIQLDYISFKTSYEQFGKYKKIHDYSVIRTLLKEIQ